MTESKCKLILREYIGREYSMNESKCFLTGPGERGGGGRGGGWEGETLLRGESKLCQLNRIGFLVSSCSRMIVASS